MIDDDRAGSYSAEFSDDELEDRDSAVAGWDEELGGYVDDEPLEPTEAEGMAAFEAMQDRDDRNYEETIAGALDYELTMTPGMPFNDTMREAVDGGWAGVEPRDWALTR